jgi:hypothetical protein
MRFALGAHHPALRPSLEHHTAGQPLGPVTAYVGWPPPACPVAPNPAVYQISICDDIARAGLQSFWIGRADGRVIDDGKHVSESTDHGG